MKRTNSGDKRSLSSAWCGLSVACMFSLAGVFLGAMLIGGESVGESSIAIYLIIVHLVSSLLGCLVAERFTSSNKLLACGITCLGYYLILIMAASLFFDGISGHAWMGFVSALAAFLLSALWIYKEDPRNKSVKRRKSHR